MEELSEDALRLRLNQITRECFGGHPYRWSQKAGTAEGTLRNFLSGQSHDFRQRSLQKLARAAGLTLSQLFDLEYDVAQPRRRAPSMADRLRWTREALGQSVEQIASALGITEGAWRAYESGEKDPSIAILRAFQSGCERAGFTVRADFLISGDEAGTDRQLLLRIAAAHPEISVDVEGTRTRPARNVGTRTADREVSPAPEKTDVQSLHTPTSTGSPQ